MVLMEKVGTRLGLIISPDLDTRVGKRQPQQPQQHELEEGWDTSSGREWNGSDTEWLIVDR